METLQNLKNISNAKHLIKCQFTIINLQTLCEQELKIDLYSDSGQLSGLELLELANNQSTQREPCYHPSTEPYEIGHCRVDPHSRSIYVNGEQRKLTNTGFRMFDYLCQRKNQLIPKSDIARDVWGLKNAPVDFSSINNFSNKIRKILSTDSGLRLDSEIDLNLKLEEDETVAHKD